MIKKNLIAIIDKKLESEHPIITNFLLGGNKFFKSLIICERSTKKKISKNKKFDTYQILRKRRNLGRFLNFFIIYFFLKNIKNSKKERLHIFVRNDPLALLAVKIAVSKNDNIIFQSSFPHEIHNKIKGFLQNVIFYFLRHIKINLISVSDLGMKRLKYYFTNYNKKMVLPLFSNFKYKKIKKKNFVITYVGSHSNVRKTQFVVESFLGFLKKIAENKKVNIKRVKFLFIGSTKNERFKLISLTKKYQKNFKFLKKIKKGKINSYLNISEVGVSIIPPLEIYKEACPTKIIEYLSCKLAVIANHEIPFQNQLLKKNVGYRVSWNKQSIIKGLENIFLDKNIRQKKNNGYKIYKEKFNHYDFQEKFYKTILS